MFLPPDGTIQYVPAPGDTVDLTWGHPAPELLPVAEWTAAYQRAVGDWTALTYGHASGPAPLREWLAAHLATVDARAPTRGELFVTAGTSQGIDLVCAAFTRPGDTVLVDAPAYHLAQQMFRDRGLTVAPLRPGATGALIYTVPTFNNPTGASLDPGARRRIVEHGIPVLEDDTYRELSYDGPPPPSLWSQGAGDVIRLGSFSKTVAPGLRLGHLTASADLVRRLAARGYVDSGGCLNHTTAMAMAHFGSSGAYGRHVARVTAAYRARRDLLVAALREHVPEAVFEVPAGGWFLWVAGLPTTAAVATVPGTRFSGDDGHRRLSFSFVSPDDLVEAARRLATTPTAPRRSHPPR